MADPPASAAISVTIVDAVATRELRRSVLRPNWAAGSVMHGDDAPGAVHLGAHDAHGTLVGACVVFPRPFPAQPDQPDAWQLRGMATAPGSRGRGVGTAWTMAAIEEVRRRGGRLVWCDAREEAVAFYRGQGFTGTGDSYPHPETGAPHLLMYRELSAAPGSSS